MKKILLLLFLVSMFSCSSDNDTNIDETSDIVTINGNVTYKENNTTKPDSYSQFFLFTEIPHFEDYNFVDGLLVHKTNSGKINAHRRGTVTEYGTVTFEADPAKNCVVIVVSNHFTDKVDVKKYSEIKAGQTINHKVVFEP